jgi:hypothetical protein
MQLTINFRSGFLSLRPSGFASRFSRSASAKLVLAYARTNFGSFQRYVQYELQDCGLLQRARASGRRAHQCINFYIFSLGKLSE